MHKISRKTSTAVLLLTAGISFLAFYMTTGIEAQQGAPRYVFDPTWPKALPSNWKMGGVTGLAVDKDDNVWVLTRPNDTTEQEDNAATNPPTAHCCVKPPTMIHISKTGEVIGSFDAPQGHGMDVDSQGFVYIGQDTVRKYDPKGGKMVQGTAARPRKPAAGRRWARARQRRSRRAGQGGGIVPREVSTDDPADRGTDRRDPPR